MDTLKKHSNYVELLFVTNRYLKLKFIQKIKCKYFSKVYKSDDFNFTDKIELHKYIEKNNNKIFKKYLLNYYELSNKNNKNEWGDIKKLFESNKKWIVKPIPGAKGFGINIFNDFNSCKKYIVNFKKDYFPYIKKTKYKKTKG